MKNFLLRVSCWHSLLSRILYFSVFFMNEGILLHNLNVTATVGKFTRTHCSHPILRSPRVLPITPVMSYNKRVQFEYIFHWAPNSLTCLSLGELLSLPLTFVTLTLLKTTQLFFRIPSVWVCLLLPHNERLGQEDRTREAAFSLRLPGGTQLPFATGAVDCLIKEMSARLLPYKVTLLPFIISKYLWGSYFKTIWIGCSSLNFQFIPLFTNISMNSWFSILSSGLYPITIISFSV